MLRLAAMLGLCCAMAGCASTGGSGLPGGAPGTPVPSTPSVPSAPPSAPSVPSAPSAPSAPSVPTASLPTANPRGDGTANPAEGGGTAQTPAEKRAQVDGKLDASLGSFDAQLQREQQRTAEERDRRAADRGDGSTGGEQTAQNRDAGGVIGGEGRDRSGDLRSEGAHGETGTGQGDPAGNGSSGAVMAQGGGGANARPLPSGEDDDIIARRLRKAAEAETDPELKEKLWKEYRDYKENTHGGRG